MFFFFIFVPKGNFECRKVNFKLIRTDNQHRLLYQNRCVALLVGGGGKSLRMIVFILVSSHFVVYRCFIVECVFLETSVDAIGAVIGGVFMKGARILDGFCLQREMLFLCDFFYRFFLMEF